MRVLLLALFLLAACDSSDKPEAQREPLFVYAPGPDMSYLPALMKSFTDETGINVVVRHRSDQENLSDMIAKSGSRPADVLITASLASIWTAAEEGVLRPLGSESGVSDMPAFLQDPDGLWAAMSVNPLVLVHSETTTPDIDGYADLGDESHKGKLCVSGSALATNQALIALLIDVDGRRNAELAVRNWIKNLAIPPRDSDAAVVQGIASGACEIGLVSLSAVAHSSSLSPILALTETVYFDGEGIGIGRHAASPEAASQLVDWLLRPDIQARHAEARGYVDVYLSDDRIAGRVSQKNVGVIGYRAEEARKLAIRAGYR